MSAQEYKCECYNFKRKPLALWYANKFGLECFKGIHIE